MGRIRCVTHLKVRALRNIRQCDFGLPPGNVLITGGNGAGKTALLEAIYVAARGRTFRARRSGPLTTVGESFTRVELGGPDRTGLAQTLVYRRLGSVVTRQWGSSELSPAPDVGLRVRLVGENCQILLDGEPGLRRRFLDWTLFHVEPGYAEALQTFRRCHWQRNAWLKSGAKGRAMWDKPYVRSAEEIDRRRQRFVKDWSSHLMRLAGWSGLFSRVGLSFNRGWHDGTELDDELARGRLSDINLGYTRLGPARADFSIQTDGSVIGFSRGQAKAIVILLQLAANQVEKERGSEGSVWLVDDLDADLDPNARSVLLGLLDGTGDQIFRTRVTGEVCDTAVDRAWAASRFHVKQGVVAPV